MTDAATARLDDASAGGRVLPEIEHPIGALRQAILDHFLDSEGDQTIAQIIAGVGGTVTRNNVEAAVLREYRAGRLVRVAPGTYQLAPPKPVEPPPPPPAAAAKMLSMAAGFGWPNDPDALAGVTEEEWFAALEAWRADPALWDAAKLGPPPNQGGTRVPVAILLRFRDRVRKREDRRKAAEEAAARQAADDRELRDQLLAAANGNYQLGPGLTDIAPVRAILETVPLDHVLFAIRANIDKRCYPGNPPLTSWRDPTFLKAVAEGFCRAVLVPKMVAAWEAPGKAPGKPADEPGTQALRECALT